MQFGTIFIIFGTILIMFEIFLYYNNGRPVDETTRNVGWSAASLSRARNYLSEGGIK